MADDAGPAGGVSVMLRIRPRNAKEQEGDDCWSWSDDAIVEVGPSGNKRYAYDRCFAPGVGNREVYECCGKPVVAGALRGVNGTIFTYGQTGSGKTHSILGVPSDPGILQRTVADIFAAVDERPDSNWTVRVSYMEVYNEEINDLLAAAEGDDKRRGKNLKIVSDDPVKGAVIAGLSETAVEHATALLDVIRSGESARAYGSTEMNDKSSRSHTICKLSIDSEEIFEGDGDDDLSRRVVKRAACLSLVDLAGSERQKSTGASGARLKEGSNKASPTKSLFDVVRRSLSPPASPASSPVGPGGLANLSGESRAAAGGDGEAADDDDPPPAPVVAAKPPPPPLEDWQVSRVPVAPGQVPVVHLRL